jgi:CheY-like chemotaxis protein
VIWPWPLVRIYTRDVAAETPAEVATHDMERLAPAIKRRSARTLPADDPCPTGVGHALIALVVDDEPLVRGFVSTVLRRQGWSVREAANATDAMAIAAAGPLDLLVTDYEMPGLTGLALAEQLRISNSRLPVLMVSGHPEAVGEIRGLDGHTAFARKPFAAAELVSTICSILS